MQNVQSSALKVGGGHDFDIIDGYDELAAHPDLQKKIRDAVVAGHIAAEDFNGVRLTHLLVW